MRKRLPESITERCEICEFAKRVAITGELLCTRKKSLKLVNCDFWCRKFSLDLLSLRPLPAKMPKFNVENPDDII